MITKTFSTLGCPQLDFRAVCRLAMAHGFPVVELRSLAGEMNLPVFLRKTYGTPVRFAEVVAESGVGVAVFGTAMKLVGAGAEMRQAFLETVEWAEALKTPYLRVFDGGRADADGAWDEARATLAWWAGEKKRTGVQADIMVETHDFLLSHPALVSFRRAAPEVRLLWDAHHTWRRGGMPLEETWAALRGSVVHIHVKDSVADPGVAAGFRYCLPGSGDFPMADLLRLLARERYAGILSLEWEKAWHPELPDLEEALAAADSLSWW